MKKRNFMDHLNESSNTVSDESKLRSWQKELMDHFNCQCKCGNKLYMTPIAKGAGKTGHCEKHNKELQDMITQAAGRNRRQDSDFHIQAVGRCVRQGIELDKPTR